ncbi:hypothetical protein [Trebonia kvetii]|nr:hypothetical protein [Trebonia kvetii]
MAAVHLTGEAVQLAGAERHAGLALWPGTRLEATSVRFSSDA